MATPLRGEFNFTWSNDGLNYIVPAANLSRDRIYHDDDGFTNDLAASVDLTKNQDHYGLHLRHRMITERDGLLRADEVMAMARVKKPLAESDVDRLDLQLGLGVMLTGPLAGDSIQDGFHRLIRWGRTLNGDLLGQLQNQYEGDVEAAPRVELGAVFTRKISGKDHLYAEASLAHSHGVGATALQAGVGFDHAWRILGGDLQVASELPLRYLHSEEARLTFRGGYPESKWFLQPQGGISYRHGAVKVGFGLVVNIEGSGANSGELSFSYYFGKY